MVLFSLIGVVMLVLIRWWVVSSPYYKALKFARQLFPNPPELFVRYLAMSIALQKNEMAPLDGKTPTTKLIALYRGDAEITSILAKGLLKDDLVDVIVGFYSKDMSMGLDIFLEYFRKALDAIGDTSLLGHYYQLLNDADQISNTLKALEKDTSYLLNAKY